MNTRTRGFTLVELIMSLLIAGIVLAQAFSMFVAEEAVQAKAARAIETQSWVIAPGQFGRHDDDGLRHSYGHSMVVDPWGTVVGRAHDGPGLALAEIDLDRLAKVRRGMPLDDHRRF